VAAEVKPLVTAVCGPTPDSARVLAHENGIAYDLDLENSQKTGFFLDQKYNRRAVRHSRRAPRARLLLPRGAVWPGRRGGRCASLCAAST
jgi:hypothetical protein